MAEPADTTNVETIAYVVHEANAPFTLEEIVLDSMAPDELLIDMQYSGICATDLSFQKGKIPVCPFPAIFGHEGAGKILAIGSQVNDKSLRVGDRVLLSINYCQKCKFCTAGHPADCTEGTRLHMHGVRPNGSTAARLKKDGRDCRFHFFGQSSFAEKSFVHETCVVKVPDEIEDEDLYALAAMGCGYQTGLSFPSLESLFLIIFVGAGTVENILRPDSSASVAIFGLGAVGLSALMAAKYLNCHQIIAIDISASKLPLAIELGATHTVDSSKFPDASELVSHIKGLSISALGVDFSIDCTGNPSVIETCLSILSMRGTAATVGVTPSGSKVSIDPLAFLLGSRTYRGCREGDSNPKEYIPHLCKKVREGKFPVGKLCKEYGHEDMETALEDVREGKVVKAVLRW